MANVAVIRVEIMDEEEARRKYENDPQFELKGSFDINGAFGSIVEFEIRRIEGPREFPNHVQEGLLLVQKKT